MAATQEAYTGHHPSTTNNSLRVMAQYLAIPAQEVRPLTPAINILPEQSQIAWRAVLYPGESGLVAAFMPSVINLLHSSPDAWRWNVSLRFQSPTRHTRHLHEQLFSVPDHVWQMMRDLQDEPCRDDFAHSLEIALQGTPRFRHEPQTPSSHRSQFERQRRPSLTPSSGYMRSSNSAGTPGDRDPAESEHSSNQGDREVCAPGPASNRPPKKLYYCFVPGCTRGEGYKRIGYLRNHVVKHYDFVNSNPDWQARVNNCPRTMGPEHRHANAPRHSHKRQRTDQASLESEASTSGTGQIFTNDDSNVPAGESSRSFMRDADEAFETPTSSLPLKEPLTPVDPTNSVGMGYPGLGAPQPLLPLFLGSQSMPNLTFTPAPHEAPMLQTPMPSRWPGFPTDTHFSDWSLWQSGQGSQQEDSGG